nr:unnamed protein product [Fasciola hepatica]
MSCESNNAVSYYVRSWLTFMVTTALFGSRVRAKRRHVSKSSCSCTRTTKVSLRVYHEANQIEQTLKSELTSSHSIWIIV